MFDPTKPFTVEDEAVVGFDLSLPFTMEGDVERPGAKASATPVTFYSLGKSIGGADETEDKWTNRGYSSKGKNLTPGVVAVNDSVYPLGTVLRDVDSGEAFLATDRHGNKDPNVVDVYVPPGAYRAAKVNRNFEVAGKVDEIPATAQGVRDVLANFGNVPEGESAEESLARLSGSGDQGAGSEGLLDRVDVPELDQQMAQNRFDPSLPFTEEERVVQTRPGVPLVWTGRTLDAQADQQIPPAEPVVRRALPVDGGFDPAKPFTMEESPADPAELSFWEKIKSRWKLGDAQATADQDAFQAATGAKRWEDVADRLDVGANERAKGGGVFSEGFLSAVQMVPAMLQGTVAGVESGGKFALATGGAAAVAGQLGPQAAAPEEIVTVPGAALAGYQVGQVYGAGKYWYQQGVGSFYHTLRKEGIPHNVASGVSQMLGVPYAAIEFSQVTKLVPGLKDVTSKVVGDSLRVSLARLAKLKGREYVEQIGQEELQELVALAAERLGETIAGVEPSPDKIPAWERLWNTAKQTALAVPFLMGPKAVTDTVATVKKTQAADGSRKGAKDAKEEAARASGQTEAARPAAVAGAEEMVNPDPFGLEDPADSITVSSDSLKSEAAGSMSGEQPLKSVSDQPAAGSLRPDLEKMQPPPRQPSGRSGAAQDSPGGLDDESTQSQTAGVVNPDEAYMPKVDGAVSTPPALPVEEALSPDGLTMPRRIEWLKPETKGNPSLRGIRKYLKKALDVPIRQGMRVSRGAMGALGVYRLRQETIRLRAMNDIPTLLHEVGHYLHHMIFPTGGDRGRASDFGGGYDAELMGLGAGTSLPSYTPQMVRLEGVAEWFRHWVADPAAARVLAPKFTAHFEAKVAKDFPELDKILRTLQQKVRQYVSQPTKAKAMGMIQWEADHEGRSYSQWFRDKYTEWFHELAPIERALDYLVGFGLPEAQARQVASLVNNYKGGWKSKADYDLEYSQTDLDGNVIGPSLKQILSLVDDQKEFATYAALKRAVEKRRQGIVTGFEDVMKAADFPAMMQAWEKRFEKARLALVVFTENQMKMLRDAGLISQGQVVAMQAANRDYVPFHRVHEGLGGAGRKSGKGYVNVGSGVMRMKGGDLEIVNPIESVIKNTMLFRELAERNRAGVAFVAAVRKTQGGGRVGESLLQPLKATQVSSDEVKARLKEVGLVLPSGAAMDLGFTIYRAAKGANAREGTFEVMVDGKPVVFQVEDKELLRALTMMDSVDAEIFSRFPMLNVLKTFTSVLRKGATLTLEFMARNSFRDQIIAGVYSKHGFVPFVDGFRGVLSMLKKDDLYREWVKAGGKYGGLYDVEVSNARELLLAVAQKDRNAVQKAAYLLNPLNVLKSLAAAGEVMEGASRVSEFRRAREQGLSSDAAAMASKDVTLNFSRSGYRGAVTNKMVAFFNASLQDMDKMGRTFKERPLAAATKAFLYITVPSMLCWWLGKDDDEIQELPEWRKSFFWNINLRPFTGQGFILTVPKPFLLGALFGTSAEKALDLAYGKDPNAVHKFFNAVLQNTLIRGDAGIATGFKPLLENMTGYSFFKGGPLETQSQKALSPGMRFNASTSLVSRLAGEKFGVSPILIDNAVRGYLGGLGRYATDAVDFFLTATQIVDVPPQPEKDLREWPVLRALLVPEDETNEYVARFYRGLDLAENRMRDFKAMGDRMETAKRLEFWMNNREELTYYGSLRGDAPVMTHLRRLRDSLGEINRAMLNVQNDRAMSPEMKRMKLNELRAQRNSMAKRGFVNGIHPLDRGRAF